jgi:hypothetical protein
MDARELLRRPSVLRIFKRVGFSVTGCAVVVLARWAYMSWDKFASSAVREAWTLSRQTNIFVLSGLGIAAFAIGVAIKWYRNGWAAVKDHLAKHLLESLLPAVGALVLLFAYNLFHTVPERIRRDAKGALPFPSLRHQSPPATAWVLSRHDARLSGDLSFPFVSPGLLINNDSWAFFARDYGATPAYNVDILIMDKEMQRAASTDNSVTVDRMYKRVRYSEIGPIGSTIGPEMIKMTPLILEHGHYSITIGSRAASFRNQCQLGTSTENFHTRCS